MDNVEKNHGVLNDVRDIRLRLTNPNGENLSEFIADF